VGHSVFIRQLRKIPCFTAVRLKDYAADNKPTYPISHPHPRLLVAHVLGDVGGLHPGREVVLAEHVIRARDGEQRGLAQRPFR
jgi:hypothetical protein